MCSGHEVLAAVDSSWRPRSGRVPRKRPGRKSGFGRHSGEVVPIGAQLAENAGVGFALSPTPTSFRGGSGRSPASRLGHAARPTIAVPNGAPMPGGQGWKQPAVRSAPPLTACLGPRPRQGKSLNMPRGGSECSPLVAWPPGSSVKTLLSALGFEQTVPSDCWSKSEGWAASLGS
jgi:hypothetical protein